MQDNEKKPALRFKGFTDPWEQRKFSELYEKVSRKNDLTYGKDDIISVANMYYKAESYITDENYLLTYNVFAMFLKWVTLHSKAIKAKILHMDVL